MTLILFIYLFEKDKQIKLTLAAWYLKKINIFFYLTNIKVPIIFLNEINTETKQNNEHFAIKNLNGTILMAATAAM